MKLLTGKKYNPSFQDSCESVLRWPARVGIAFCVFVFLFFSTTLKAQGFYVDPSRNNNDLFQSATTAHQSSTIASAVTAVVSSGNWNDPTSWSSNAVPTASDDVIIPLGSTITINADGISCQNLTISGTLAGAGSYSLNVYGNWLNNGTYSALIDTVRFMGSTGATISGTSATSFNNIKIDKSGNTGAIVEVIGGSGVTNSGNITLANGILELSSGTFQFKSNPNMPSTTGLWVNGGTVSTVGSFSIDNNGSIKVSSGTFNVGNASGNSLTTSGTSGKFEINGGTVNVAGRLENTNGTAIISGGIITVSTAGNALSSAGSFHMSANTDFTMSGGTVVFQKPSTAGTQVDLYIVSGGTGTKNISGGTFQFGNTSTPVASSFVVNSVVALYNFSISTTNASVKLSTNDLTIANQLTLSGGAVDANGKTVIISNGAATAISRSSGYVIGDLKRGVAGIALYGFPVGTANGYTPVNINFTGGIYSGAYATVKSNSVKHPNDLNTTDYLNRYWNITTTGISSPVYDITATYLISDVLGSESKLTGAKYISSWSKTGVLNTVGKTITFSSTTDEILSISGILACDLAGGTITPTNVSCFGGSDGAISISGVTGGSGSYQYSINGGTSWQGSGSFTGLTTGNYNLQVRDATDNTCLITLTALPVTITQPVSAVSVALTSQTNVLCFGQSTG
ncbi:MAG TPA: hypothetical protein VNT20_06945, partial [Flavisolibacter sp.]|nr:hypothetical protein [Flavisolibacter sp.]